MTKNSPFEILTNPHKGKTSFSKFSMLGEFEGLSGSCKVEIFYQPDRDVVAVASLEKFIENSEEETFETAEHLCAYIADEFFREVLPLYLEVVVAVDEGGAKLNAQAVRRQPAYNLSDEVKSHMLSSNN